MSLILASASPRRRELLTQLGVAFDCEPADIDEALLEGELPADYVQRVAAEKARAVALRYSGEQRLVLGADTTVVIDRQVLGKPVDHLDGLSMLARLSGRSHQVMTAICLVSAEREWQALVTTDVEFSTLSREVCESYLASGEAWDKAGAYGIQGLGGALVHTLSGSYSNVVGLPLAETWRMLAAAGVPTALAAPDGDVL